MTVETEPATTRGRCDNTSTLLLPTTTFVHFNDTSAALHAVFSALTLLAGHQEEHLPYKKLRDDVPAWFSF